MTLIQFILTIDVSIATGLGVIVDQGSENVVSDFFGSYWPSTMTMSVTAFNVFPAFVPTKRVCTVGAWNACLTI